MIAFSIIFLGMAYYQTEGDKAFRDFWPVVDPLYIMTASLVIYWIASRFIST